MVDAKSLLSVAVVSRRHGLVRLLLEVGADPNRSVGGGINALHLATKLRDSESVAMLCNAGADPHLAADNGPSPLSLALGQRDFVCYSLLASHFILAHGPAERLLAQFEVLRAAIAAGSAEFVEGLLKALDRQHLPVTDRAITFCAREGTGETMKVLLAHGGSANAVERGQHEIPAIVLCSALGNHSALATLLSSDEPIDLEQPCIGLTSLMHASKEGHLECMTLLLDHGAKVDTVRESNGWTALFFACSSRRNHAAALLLDRGANVRHTDTAKQTALHITSANRVVELLLRHGADPNAMDSELRTPLFRPTLTADYMSIVHLLRFGADPRLAHWAHCQRLKDEPRRKDDPNFVADPQAIERFEMGPEDKVDPVLWIPEADREELLKDFKEEQMTGSATRSRLDLATDLLNHGMVWIPWKTSNHYLFPANVRRTIFTFLLCRKRPESLLSILPRDVVLHICSFVATPGDWRSGQLEDWDWHEQFSEKCWQFDVSSMMSSKVKSCLDLGQCTKHLTGVQFLFQPFYKCVTCRFGEEFGNHLGMCQSCRDTCHKDHDTQIGGFLPAFCDCGDSARCQLDSQWSLLSSEKDQIDISKDGDEKYRYLIAICEFHDPVVFRELQRPENLLHAVPGDIIRVEWDKLDGPEIMCEGKLHGETGMFPANRSYVLPMREFVRALEDAELDGSSDQLKFKAGDLILPLGQWDGNCPEGKAVRQLIKGRLISPSGKFSEGWFCDYSADLVMNYDILRRREKLEDETETADASVIDPKPPVFMEINWKRHIVERIANIKRLVHAQDISALIEIHQLQGIFGKIVGSRETWRLSSSMYKLDLWRSQLMRLVQDLPSQQSCLRVVIEALQEQLKRTPTHVATFRMLIWARAQLVMSLFETGGDEDFQVHLRSLMDVSGDPDTDDRSALSVALWRLATFAFLECRTGKPNCVQHVEKLEQGLSEAKKSRDSASLVILLQRLKFAAHLVEQNLGAAANALLGLASLLEKQGKLLELLAALEQLGSFMFHRVRNHSLALQSLDRFDAVWRSKPECASFPGLLSLAYQAQHLRGVLGGRVQRHALAQAGSLISRMRSLPSGREVAFQPLISGFDLVLSVKLVEESKVIVGVASRPGVSNVAGRLHFVVKRKKTYRLPCDPERTEVVEVEDGWTEREFSVQLPPILEKEDEEEEETMTCKVFFTTADDRQRLLGKGTVRLF